MGFGGGRGAAPLVRLVPRRCAQLASRPARLASARGASGGGPDWSPALPTPQRSSVDDRSLGARPPARGPSGLAELGGSSCLEPFTVFRPGQRADGTCLSYDNMLDERPAPPKDEIPREMFSEYVQLSSPVTPREAHGRGVTAGDLSARSAWAWHDRRAPRGNSVGADVCPRTKGACCSSDRDAVGRPLEQHPSRIRRMEAQRLVACPLRGKAPRRGEGTRRRNAAAGRRGERAPSTTRDQGPRSRTPAQEGRRSRLGLARPWHPQHTHTSDFSETYG